MATLSGIFWGLSSRAWWRLPHGVRESRGGLAYGRWVHSHVLRKPGRQMHVYSTFLRNRLTLELMRRLIQEKEEGATLNLAVLGCSIGAEVYSILWVIRSARPDLEVVVTAVDVSAEVVAIGEAGIYAPAMSAVVDPGIFDRLTEREMQDMFDWKDGTVQVKGWLREGIAWHVDDACDPELGSRLGRQDIVVASNFLCHLEPASAECCLRNIGRLVEPAASCSCRESTSTSERKLRTIWGGSPSLIYSRRFTTPIRRCGLLGRGSGPGSSRSIVADRIGGRVTRPRSGSICRRMCKTAPLPSQVSPAPVR